MNLLASIKLLLLLVLLGSLAFAVFAVLPQKVRLLKRVGANKTNDDLIALATQGDPEAKQLRTRTRWFIGTALASGLPLAILQTMARQ
jgi:hypothetical protein